MRFLILGATGPSGVLLIRKTLEVYPDSTIIVFARSPNKIPEDLRNNGSLTIVKGTFDDLDELESAVQLGIDVVLSALGPVVSPSALTTHSPTTPIATFYGHLIDLLYKYNVKRFISLSTASVTDPHDKPSLKYAAIVRGVKTVAYPAYADIVAMGEVIRSKGQDLDYTLVRVPFLTNGDTEGVYAGYIGDGKIGVTLSRKGFAAFSVGEVANRKWVKAAPMISNA
ncbi:hypothetical protein JR316_0001890 [Psilocybe cubensis]|uniref:Uncharacterized protein n=2 Tax=Psilocybe cubensis TaxID=181762 RepID=A0ACB8HAN8_PSICU|nr:hypothetical protein JR316_0001890 [Psilocybe cubensis]KAH9484986.1 hypothetical protein JR316_0001890 [Psilocybe cubensis]